jgi:AcrR family transcriptional regulator
MEVKGKRGHQGQETRAALVAAARELFGNQGYAATPLDEIVAKAGVTKGALYHHFADKESLFRAVFEEVEREVAEDAAVEFMRPDSWEALVLGCRLWVDAHSDPAVRQIALVDARGVLGWATARAIETRFSTVTIRGALRKAMNAGVLTRQPLRPLAVMLAGALSEACLFVAESENPEVARDEVGALIVAMLSGMHIGEQAGSESPIPDVVGHAARWRTHSR